MSDIAISVENLSKAYLVGHNATAERYTALRDVLARHARNLIRKTRDMAAGRQIVQGDDIEEFWALKDVSFEVKRGEVLGVIGRNGAGKSTLLKVLSRITEPTKGRIAISGRVASLLEVGTGFHPELTGRENIFLNGAILGMSRQEIKNKFDEIVDFAEVEKFLDTPVKRYSSGMYVRLAFAVAAHLESEILVIDEVLAVGDAEFQKKCLGKMKDVAGHGRTVLFVSHNLAAMHRLCQTGILLDAGKLITSGTLQSCVDSYLSKTTHTLELSADFSRIKRPISTDPKITISSAEILSYPTLQDREFKIRICVKVTEPIAEVVFGFGFCNTDGSRILSSDTDYAGYPGYDFVQPGEFHIEAAIPNLPLSAGQYVLDIGCRTLGGRMLDVVASAMTLSVQPSESSTIVQTSGYRTALTRAHWESCPA